MSFFRSEDLVVRYGRAPSPALNRVTMTVPEGSLYAVLGPNGSGKSTLMRALLGAVAPEAGDAWLGGRGIGGWTRREVALKVGVVSQSESIAFPMSVRELVSMGRYPHLGPLKGERDDDRRAIGRALEWCDASKLEDRNVTTLSGGEFQRVRIARALAQEPDALALDEPTASLDIRHEMTIFALMRQSAAEGMTVLLTTHNLNLAARFADRILLLDGGIVAAEGTAEEVLTAEIIERVYRWPVSVQTDPETGAPQIIPRLNS